MTDNDAYARTYTDVFADPLEQEQFKQAAGLQIDLLSEELYDQIVGALYLILPPPQLKASSEQFIGNLIVV